MGASRFKLLCIFRMAAVSLCLSGGIGRNSLAGDEIQTNDPGNVSSQEGRFFSYRNDIPGCDVKSDARLVRRYPLPRSVDGSWFIRPFSASPKLGFAAQKLDPSPAGGEIETNMVLDLKTGKTYDTVGDLDPSYLMQDRVMGTPVAAEDGSTRMTFYGLDRSTGKEMPIKPLFVDQRNHDQYQTVARVAKGGYFEKYAMLTASGTGLKLWKYVVSNPQNPAPSVDPDGPPVKICPGRELSLPMLSADGKEFAAFDTFSKSTIIATVDGCRVEQEFPFMTGKMSFSPDGSKVAFHVDSFYQGGGQNSPEGFSYGHLGKDAGGSVRRIDLDRAYVYDRKTGRFSNVSPDDAANSIYPTFLSDGSIAMNVLFPNNSRSIDVVQLDPARSPSPEALEALCDPRSRSFAAITAIGAVFTAVCKPARAEKNNFSISGSVLSALSLKPENCKKLVHDYWLKLRDSIAQDVEAHRQKSIEDMKELNDFEHPHEYVITQDAVEGLQESDLLAACP